MLRQLLITNKSHTSPLHQFYLPLTNVVLLQKVLCKVYGLSLLLGDSRYIGKKPVKNCLNARAKMTSDKFDDERLLARKTNENKMKNG